MLVDAIVADDERGFVSVRESAERPTKGVWTGVHAWEFGGGRIARFESYYDDAYCAFWSGQSAPAADANG